MSDDRHCLHALLLKQRHNKILNSLRSRGHNYVLPQIELTLFINSFLNRCFSCIWVFAAQLYFILFAVCLLVCLFVCFYRLLFMSVLMCNVCVCQLMLLIKRQFTYLLTYFINMLQCNAFKCLVADISVISHVLISRSVTASSASSWRSGSVHIQMLLVVHWLSFQWSLISVKLCVFTFDPKETWIMWLKLRNVDFRVF